MWWWSQNNCSSLFHAEILDIVLSKHVFAGNHISMHSCSMLNQFCFENMDHRACQSIQECGWQQNDQIIDAKNWQFRELFNELIKEIICFIRSIKTQIINALEIPHNPFQRAQRESIVITDKDTSSGQVAVWQHYAFRLNRQQRVDQSQKGHLQRIVRSTSRNSDEVYLQITN